MIDDPRGPVQFDPVRIGPRRRRFDPLLLGVLAVVVALGAAIVKPWESAPAGVASSSASPSGPGSGATASSSPATQSAPSALPAPLDADVVLGAITDRDAYGLGAIVASGAGYIEHWAPVTTFTQPNVELGSLPPVVALAITTPDDQVPLDVRIYRFVADGSWAWLDAPPLASDRPAAALVFEPPRIGGAPGSTWAPGDYRIELLTPERILRMNVAVLDDRGIVGPGLPFLPPVATPHRDPILQTQLAFGPFVVVGDVAQSVGGSPVAPDGTVHDAWLDLPPPGATTAAHRMVRAAFGVSAFGIALPGGSTDVSAGIEQLAPDQQAIYSGFEPVYESDRSDTPPYVIYHPIGTTWSPGVYSLTASWAGPRGRSTATWEITVFPGAVPDDPTNLGAVRAFARFAGKDGLVEASPATISAQGPAAQIQFLPFIRERAKPTAIAPVGCGPRSLDGLARIIAVAQRRGLPDLQVRVALMGPDGTAAPIGVMSATLEGLTIVRPARVAAFPAGTYVLTIDDGTLISTATVCLGGTPDPG